MLSALPYTLCHVDSTLTMICILAFGKITIRKNIDWKIHGPKSPAMSMMTYMLILKCKAQIKVKIFNDMEEHQFLMWLVKNICNTTAAVCAITYHCPEIKMLPLQNIE